MKSIMKFDKTKDAAVDVVEGAVDLLASSFLHGILASDVVKAIPGVKVTLAMVEGVNNIRSFYLLKKLDAFLDVMSTVSEEKRKEMVDKLQSSKFCDHVGMILLEKLERSEAQKKPRMIGLVFKALANEVCNVNEFDMLTNVIERLPLSSINYLSEFSSSTQPDELKKIPEYVRQSFMVSGLAYGSALLSGGFDFNPNALCHLLVRILDESSFDELSEK